jgi:hypothetical protein
MPGPAVWSGGSNSGGNASTPSTPQENTLPESTPTSAPQPSTTDVASPPATSAAAVHTDENCTKGRIARARRAFRDAIRRA